MKRPLLPYAFVALLIFSGSRAAADRPSTDETAIRLGVSAWSAPWKNSAPSASAGSNKLFVSRSNLIARTSPTAAWLATFSTWTAQPADVAVTTHGDEALATFVLHAEGTDQAGATQKAAARITLTWQRINGLWQIAREQAVPLTSAVAAEWVTAK